MRTAREIPGPSLVIRSDVGGEAHTVVGDGHPGPHPRPAQQLAARTDIRAVADHPVAPDVGGSVLARVVTPYDPSDGTLTVLLDDVATLEAMVLWLSTKSNPHLFARVWNPGDVAGDDDDSPIDDTSIGIPFVPGVPVDLAGTGLTVTFDKDGIVGDHWILAARPATTHDVVPWDLARSPSPATSWSSSRSPATRRRSSSSARS